MSVILLVGIAIYFLGLLKTAALFFIIWVIWQVLLAADS